MKCPGCGGLDDRVIDSRFNPDNNSIRRRRACLACEFRYTTYERLEAVVVQVVKSDGQRQPWDAAKILEGVRKACEKRPVESSQMEDLARGVQREVFAAGHSEISSERVGRYVMRHLREVDAIAYVRFASVYLKFSDVSDFVEEIERLTGSDRTSNPDASAIAAEALATVDDELGDGELGDERDATAEHEAGPSPEA